MTEIAYAIQTGVDDEGRVLYYPQGSDLTASLKVNSEEHASSLILHEDSVATILLHDTRDQLVTAELLQECLSESGFLMENDNDMDLGAAAITAAIIKRAKEETVATFTLTRTPEPGEDDAISVPGVGTFTAGEIFSGRRWEMAGPVSIRWRPWNMMAGLSSGYEGGTYIATTARHARLGWGADPTLAAEIAIQSDERHEARAREVLDDE